MNPIQAEQAVIGAVMLTGRAATYHAVADILRADDFTDPRHNLLWSVFAELVQRDSPIDAVTVAEWVSANGISGLAGSDGYILDLANNTPSAASIRAYAEIVVERSRLRDVRRVGATLAACPENATAAEIAAKYTSDLLAIAGRRSQTVVTWREAIRSAWTELESSYRSGGVMPGSLMTPWRELNRIMIAMRPADFVVLAGRPGMGKTAVALNMILHAARQVRHRKECEADPWMSGAAPNPHNPRWKQHLECLLDDARFRAVMDGVISAMRAGGEGDGRAAA